MDRRDHVRRAERDGRLKKYRPKYVRASVDAGIEAHRNNVPRLENPQLGHRGKSWTYGWNLGFGVRIEIKTRLLGINAPEVRGPEKKKGLETKLFLGHAMDEAFLRKSLRVESHNKSGKFGRWLVTVWDGDVNLNKLMVENGLAEFKEY